MIKRALPLAALTLLAAGCAEENPHYPTSAGVTGRRGHASPDTATRFQGRAEITDQDVKDAKPSADTTPSN